MIVRRVVTGQASGKSRVVSDGRPSRSYDFVHIPGMSSSLVWSTPATPVIPSHEKEAIKAETSFLPATGETRLAIVTFAPDSVAARSDFDGAAAGGEYMAQMPDFASKFERDNPGMHTTESVDYGIVLEGEIWLELDDGQQVHLKPHDVVIQNGTRHAWRNKTDRPATIAFVLIGAKRG